MMAYPNAVFSFFAFVGVLMCVLPFPWHLEAWRTGASMYMIWTGIACLNQFINSIVWNGNAIDFAPIWCDISSRIIVGISVAIPAAALCITRRLYYISSATTTVAGINKAGKRREIIIDLCICVGLPVLEMVLQYIVQGHRYNIFEDIGCFPFTYNTWPAYVIVVCPPIAIGCVSAFYAISSIIHINRRRAKFNELLSSHSNLNSSIYMRLMCLAGVEAICTVPLGCLNLYFNIQVGIEPWISWEDTHYGFSRVDQVLAIFWRADHTTRVSLELTRWFVVICAFVFFAFFGFADEARRNYRAIFRAMFGWMLQKQKHGSQSGSRDAFEPSAATPTSPGGLGSLRFSPVTKDDTFASMNDGLFTVSEDAEKAETRADPPSTSFDLRRSLSTVRHDQPTTIATIRAHPLPEQEKRSTTCADDIV